MLVGLLAVVVSLATAPATSSAATGNFWKGNTTFVINYGSYALIDRPLPNLTPGASNVLINSYTIPPGSTGQWFMQAGISRTTNNGCPPGQYWTAFAEYVGKNTNNQLIGKCFIGAIQDGQNSIYNQTNNDANPYWCAGFNNQPCLHRADESLLGMTNGTYVTAYGETTNTDATMGNKSPNWAYIRKVSYKASRTGQINNPIRVAGSAEYLTCGAPCPYIKEAFDEQFSGTYFLTVRLQTP